MQIRAKCNLNLYQLIRWHSLCYYRAHVDTVTIDLKSSVNGRILKYG